MNPYNDYIIKYGNFSYILNININNELCESEIITITSTIHDILNEKQIIKNIYGTDFPVIWRVSNENDLLHYYTNGCGFIMSDNAIHLHTKMVLNDIRQLINKDKFSFMVTKPLTKKICI